MRKAFHLFHESRYWKNITIIILTTVILAVILYNVFLNDAILYHSLAEALTIIAATVMIIIVVSVWSYIKNNIFISVISIATFITALIDIFHIFAYPGLTYYPSKYAVGTLITAFWTFARYFQAITFLVAVLLAKQFKKINYYYVTLSFFIVATIGITLIFYGFFPETYSSDIGLTPFKVISEYIVMALFALLGYLIVRFKLAKDNYSLSLLLLFIIFQIATEFALTQYILPTDIALFTGHFFKIIASIILTHILIINTIMVPSEGLYNETIQQKDMLTKLLKYETLVREVTEICVSAVRDDSFIDKVLTALGSTLEVDHTFVYRINYEKNTFKLTNGWFSTTSKLITADEGYEYDAVQSFLSKMEKGDTHYCADTSLLESVNVRDNFLAIGIYAYINEPLFVFGKFIGFIGYNMTTTNRETLEDDITLIKSIAKILTQTIERVEQFKEIEYLSNRDDLTGAYNRRYFENYIKQVDNDTFYPLGLVVIDLNGLKLINDAFGHNAGDEMLIKTVELLDSSVGDMGSIFRIGGDEFVILFPDSSEDFVYEILNGIEKKCEDIYVSSVQLSLAYGVHIRTSNRSPFYEEFKIAEDEMYRMKLIDVPSMRANAIETILNTLFEKDQYSKEHSSNVSVISEKLATKMGLNVAQVNDIKMASLLHDIGKIIVPDQILKKEGKLTHLEYLEIKKHSEIGFRILSSTKDFRVVANYVLSHHEYYDGNGYPKGLKGEEIPIESRIISVADAFDAMTSYRSYRDNFSVEEALEELKRCSGTQFDPKVVEVFVTNYKSIYKQK